MVKLAQRSFMASVLPLAVCSLPPDSTVMDSLELVSSVFRKIYFWSFLPTVNVK